MGMSRTDFMLKYSQGKILDIGCTGKDGGSLHREIMKHNSDVYGIDVRSLDTPRFILGNCYMLPFPDDGFDTVIMGEVIEHLLYPDIALGEVKRVLKPSGKLVVTCPNDYSSGRIINYVLRNKELEQNSDHKWVFTPRMIERLLVRYGFNVLELKTLKPNNRFGNYIALCACNRSQMLGESR